MNRRQILQSIAASAAVAGCKAGECALTDEQIEGPYYFDADATRIDITEGKTGIPMTLHFQVIASLDCAVIADAEVDIWQADAEGVYSGFEAQETVGETYLRGIQITDVNGECQIETIFPGFYDGRTTHIHVKVRAEGYAELTTQLYFPDDVNAEVAPEYTAQDDYTTNRKDTYFTPDNEMEVDGDIVGYTATHVLGLELA